MASNVINFPESKTGCIGISLRVREIEPIAVHAGMADWLERLDQVLVLGVTHDGQLYAAATHPDVADNTLLMERFRRKIMRVFGDDEFADEPNG